MGVSCESEGQNCLPGGRGWVQKGVNCLCRKGACSGNLMKPVAMEEARMAGKELGRNLPLPGEKTKMAPQSTSGCPAVCPEEEKKQTNKEPKIQ